MRSQLKATWCGVAAGANELLFSKPIWRDLERPDFAAERSGVAAGDPEFVLEDVGGMLVAGFPGFARFQFGPVFAVFRGPNVA